MTTENSRLPLNCFKQVVQHAPLCAVDLVVVNSQNEVLVGERINAPAKGFWFVPGGRVYKNEKLKQALQRIAKSELGLILKSLNQTTLLGLYEHFYKDSFFSPEISTHYINATHVLRLEHHELNLPKEQHGQYRWLGIESLREDASVHQYSKVFFFFLITWLTSSS